MPGWAPRSSRPAWLTLRRTVTLGSTGSRRATTTTRSASMTVTVGGAAPGSPTAQVRKFAPNADEPDPDSGGLSLTPSCRFGAPFRCATSLLDTRPQRGHQVIDATAGQDLGGGWPCRSRPALDQLFQPLPVFIGIALRLERPGQGVDQQRGHLPFFLAQVPGLGGLQLGGGQDCVAVEL